MFHFDEIGENLNIGVAEAEIGLALVRSGTFLLDAELSPRVRVAHDRRPVFDPQAAEEQRKRFEADRAAGKAVGRYICQSDLEAVLGEANVIAMSQGLPPIDPEVKAKYTTRRKAFRESAVRISAELEQIRRKFYPEHDIADFRDGPPEYVSEIAACVDRLMPPPNVRIVIEMVRKARHKLSNLDGGLRGPSDRQEMRNYFGYFRWFADRFDLFDAPIAPDWDEGGIKISELRQYFRAFQAFLEKNVARVLFYETELSKYIRSQERFAPSRDMHLGDNESKEQVLVGEFTAIVGTSGHIFRPVYVADWGIDGEIEFKDGEGKATGRRVYVQLKSGDSYLIRRASDGNEIFTVKNDRHLEYWVQQAYPVMLVIRQSSGLIRWMNITEYLKNQSDPKCFQVIFRGEEVTPDVVQGLADCLAHGLE